MTWEEFLTTKFGLWIIHTCTENTLYCNGKAAENSILLQIDKAVERSDGDLTCVFRLEDAVAHLATSASRGILTIAK